MNRTHIHEPAFPGLPHMSYSTPGGAGHAASAAQSAWSSYVPTRSALGGLLVSLLERLDLCAAPRILTVECRLADPAAVRPGKTAPRRETPRAEAPSPESARMSFSAGDAGLLTDLAV